MEAEEREEGGSTNRVRHVAYSSTFWAKVNLVNQVLGSTPQTCKACACPASRLKKEPGVSKGVISGLMDGGAYMPEQGLAETPPVYGG